MTQGPKTVFIDGIAYNRVDIPATGDWQLMEIKSLGLYILVHPNGRQAWFHETDLARASLRIANFRYTNTPMADLRKLARQGDLRPFHVDPDFDPDTVATLRLPC